MVASIFDGLQGHQDLRLGRPGLSGALQVDEPVLTMAYQQLHRIRIFVAGTGVVDFVLYFLYLIHLLCLYLNYLGFFFDRSGSFYMWGCPHA